MSNEQATATYITSYFETMAKTQSDSNVALAKAISELKDDNNKRVDGTNHRLDKIVDSVGEIKKVLYLHDTRLTEHSENITQIEAKVESLNVDVAQIKKRFIMTVALSAVGLASSAAAYAADFGIKIPMASMASFFGWLIQNLRSL